jgi:hypothetical protein
MTDVRKEHQFDIKPLEQYLAKTVAEFKGRINKIVGRINICKHQSRP